LKDDTDYRGGNKVLRRTGKLLFDVILDRGFLSRTMEAV
jgi:hypothetical protein